MRLRHLIPVIALATLPTSCDSTDPNPLAGTFVATSFVVTEAGESPTDVLALGGGLTITIAENNTTSGTLTVPDELTGGGDLSYSMAGTATRTGTTVHFEQEADTFVRDIPWTFSGNNLNANATVAGVALVITLARQ